MSHKKRITAMTLTQDQQYLVTGDSAGLLYVWATSDLNEPSSPTSESKATLINNLELHNNKGAITNIIAINRPLSLFGLTANMNEYAVPQIKPLSKIAGEFEQQIEFNCSPEMNDTYNIDASEAAFWANAGIALDTRPKEEKGLTKGEVESLREENRRLKRTLIERFEMQMG